MPPEQLALLERCLALALQSSPERVLERAQEYLDFIQVGPSGHGSLPKGTSRKGRGSD